MGVPVCHVCHRCPCACPGSPYVNDPASPRFGLPTEAPPALPPVNDRTMAPTKPVSDPRVCPRCHGVIHLAGCPNDVAWTLERGYHVRGPSGAAEGVGGGIGRPDDPTPRATPPSPGNGPWLHLATGVHVQEGSTVVHITSKERVTLEGLYPTPSGETLALVKWANGSKSLIEPSKLRKVDESGVRSMFVAVEGLGAFNVSDSETAELVRTKLKGLGVTGKHPIHYGNGERVEGLFAWFTVD